MKKQDHHRSLWRNRSARSAVNREDGGSSPPRDGWWFFLHLWDVAAYPMSDFCHLSHDLFIMPMLPPFFTLWLEGLKCGGFPATSYHDRIEQQFCTFFKRELAILDNTEKGLNDFVNVIWFHWKVDLLLCFIGIDWNLGKIGIQGKSHSRGNH